MARVKPKDRPKPEKELSAEETTSIVGGGSVGSGTDEARIEGMRHRQMDDVYGRAEDDNRSFADEAKDRYRRAMRTIVDMMAQRSQTIDKGRGTRR